MQKLETTTARSHETKQVLVTMPFELHKKAKLAAVDAEKTLADWIKEAIQLALK